MSRWAPGIRPNTASSVGAVCLTFCGSYVAKAVPCSDKRGTMAARAVERLPPFCSDVPGQRGPKSGSCAKPEQLLAKPGDSAAAYPGAVQARRSPQSSAAPTTGHQERFGVGVRSRCGKTQGC